jgi:hypothetical protein
MIKCWLFSNMDLRVLEHVGCFRMLMSAHRKDRFVERPEKNVQLQGLYDPPWSSFYYCFRSQVSFHVVFLDVTLEMPWY